VPGFDVVGWVGLFAPAATPRAIIEDIQKAVITVLARPDIIEKLARQGAEAAVPADQPGFGDFLVADRRKWKDLAASAGIKDPD